MAEHDLATTSFSPRPARTSSRRPCHAETTVPKRTYNPISTICPVPEHSTLRPVPIVGQYVTPRTLLALPRSPSDDLAAWQAAEANGPHGVAVVGPGTDTDLSDIVAWLVRLAAAGIRPLGYLSLGYGNRAAAAVRADIRHWAMLPVLGIFLDHAPPGPFHLGPVVSAVRAARRSGLRGIVVNPGVAVDPAYRRIDATICTFEGTWPEYAALPAGRCEPGDGHLVSRIPLQDAAAARELAAVRRAGLVLLTDGAMPVFDAAIRSRPTVVAY